MKKISWCMAIPGLLILFLTFAFQAEAALPKTYQEFKSRYQKEAKTPERALKLYFEAVFCYIDENTRSEASKMLRYAMHLDRPLENSANNATFVDRMKDPYYNYMFRSYALGTSPQNDYKMSPDNFELAIGLKKKESDYTRVQVNSSGADNPRFVWMKEFDGLWYIINNASTYVQVRAPKNPISTNKNKHDADFDSPPEPSKKQEDELQKDEEKEKDDDVVFK